MLLFLIFIIICPLFLSPSYFLSSLFSFPFSLVFVLFQCVCAMPFWFYGGFFLICCLGFCFRFIFSVYIFNLFFVLLCSLFSCFLSVWAVLFFNFSGGCLFVIVIRSIILIGSTYCIFSFYYFLYFYPLFCLLIILYSVSLSFPEYFISFSCLSLFILLHLSL